MAKVNNFCLCKSDITHQFTVTHTLYTSYNLDYCLILLYFESFKQRFIEHNPVRESVFYMFIHFLLQLLILYRNRTFQRNNLCLFTSNVTHQFIIAY